MNNALLNSYHPESQFGGFSEIDGTVRFYDRVNALLNSQFTVLDAGCGVGAYENDPVEFRKQLRILKGKCRHVIGIDVDPEAATNPHIDEFRQIEGDRWPVDDESIDLCVTDYVLEHIESPDSFFGECARVFDTASSTPHTDIGSI